MKELDIPQRVERFGKSWAQYFAQAQPNWHEQHHDAWHSYEGYDLNLWVEDGQLTMSVYPLIDDGTGFMTTDTSTWKTIVKKEVRS
jgi:hypothetical protein